MAVSEANTDYIVRSLLEQAGISPDVQGSEIFEVKEALSTASKNETGNLGRPEFTAVVKDFLIVIEDKSTTDKQVRYINPSTKEDLLMDTTSIKSYAENGALHYALKIVQYTSYKKVIAIGCSGTDRNKLLIQPIFVTKSGRYKILPFISSFTSLNDRNIDRYYREVILGKDSVESVELKDILTKANNLHEALRNYGQLGDAEKPLIVSAILLALQDPQFSTEQLTGEQEQKNTDGDKIFDALVRYMDTVHVEPYNKKDKVIDQFRLIVNRPQLSQIDSHLRKTPLRYFAEFIHANVLNAIYNNHPEDVLGRFYGEFMHYSGGNSKTLGVVLTPKHITELFTDLLDIQPTDKVLDPCCGTGGFLIAAMSKMLVKSNDEQQRKNIKQNLLHGVEIRDDMFAIATTNMILRGDGKSNLLCDDFFKIPEEKLQEQKFTIGMMNPPYAQGKKKDMKHLTEWKFICHLLDGLTDKAKCAVIVPQSVMTGNNREDKDDKRYVYNKHTIEGVITLNTQTFFSIGTNPVIIVFTAHQPHPADKLVKFVDFRNDGYEVVPHTGLLPVSENIIQERKKLLLDCWLQGKQAPESFIIRTTIVPEDEWLHSFYYFNEELPTEDMFDKTIADYLTFQYNMITHGRGYLFDDGKEDDDA